MVDNKRYYFEDGGIYNMFSLMRDRETQSLWHHATGEALHGELKGKTLGDSDMMHQMTASQTIERFPKAQIALSRNSSFLKKLVGMLGSRIYAPDKGGIPLPPMRRFMDPQDKRLSQMEVGLGVWSGDEAHFYERQVIQSNNRAVVDTINGRRIMVYIDPVTHTPTAFYTNALSFWWTGNTLHFNDGAELRNGLLYDANGKTSNLEYPRQVFTRWYGFAYTFPDCEIYGQPKNSE
jgi:hypothetical protein